MRRRLFGLLASLPFVPKAEAPRPPAPQVMAYRTGQCAFAAAGTATDPGVWTADHIEAFDAMWRSAPYAPPIGSLDASWLPRVMARTAALMPPPMDNRPAPAGWATLENVR